VSLTPESIEVGKCYLMQGRLSRVRRVVSISENGTVGFLARRNVKPTPVWIPGTQSLRSFAAAAACEIPDGSPPSGKEEVKGLPPESIRVGACYLTQVRLSDGRIITRVRRVAKIRPDGRVQYAQRRGPVAEGHRWRAVRMMSLEAFARSVEWEVPCDWTPETDEERPWQHVG
jgi:hypothetical protein